MSDEIKVASVTINALRIDPWGIDPVTITPDSLTRAIFDQLPEGELIDPHVPEFRGPIWGRVTYGDRQGVWGIVFQVGDELYRCDVEMHRIRWGEAFRRRWTGDYTDRWNALLGRLHAVRELWFAT